MTTANPSDYTVEPLTDRHDRAAFRCGVDALDRYFHLQAGQEGRKRVSSCFVMVAGDGSVLGYYTLSSTSVALVDLPARTAKKLPRYPAVPATLLGRLAVDHRHHRRGLGELLLLDAFSRPLRSEIALFAIVVDAKDDQAQAFYQRYRFLPLPSAGRRMFVPLAEIAALFA